MVILGVMSGSSLDGLDLALVDFTLTDNQWEWHLIDHQTEELPVELRDQLANIVNADVFQVAHTNSEYSSFVGHSINQFLDSSKVKPQAIGIHGHTVLHLPEHHISWQLLNGGQLSEITHTPIVCDFRNQDMALGGQGTPMAVLSDRDLFKGYDAYINLGGISNISYIKNGAWVGYDISGCNQYLNHFSNKLGLAYDSDGQLAQAGKLVPELLALLDSDPYLKKAIPKSLDNTYIKNSITKLDNIDCIPQDALHTTVHFIKTELLKAIDAGEANSVLVTGGGAKNKFLIESLQSLLSKEERLLAVPGETIIDFKESILIAYAALLRWHEKPNFVSSATGARRDVIGGAVYLPSNYQNHV